MKLLLQRNANAHTPDYFGFTPLHKTVEFLHFEVIQLLFQYNVDVNEQTFPGNDKDKNRIIVFGQMTPLHIVVALKNYEQDRIQVIFLYFQLIRQSTLFLPYINDISFLFFNDNDNNL